MALGGSLAIELQGRGVILLEPLGAFGNDDPQPELRIEIALQARLAIPLGGFSEIELGAIPRLIGHAHRVLGIDIADLGEFQALVEWHFLDALGKRWPEGQ